METKKLYDPEQIKQAIELIYEPGEPFEVRILKGKKKTISGYFDNAENVIKALPGVDLRGANVYITPQKLHQGCKARFQWNCFLDTSSGDISATSDNDIVAYKYLLIDLDPVRPAGISSSEEELRAAWELKNEVTEYLISNGFDEYIVACSGNGYHILAKMDLPNNTENKEIVKQKLERLDKLFSTEACHVDTTAHNPSRVFKLYGTLAQKGRDTADRPHRMSQILEVHNAETD